MGPSRWGRARSCDMSCYLFCIVIASSGCISTVIVPSVISLISITGTDPERDIREECAVSYAMVFQRPPSSPPPPPPTPPSVALLRAVGDLQRDTGAVSVSVDNLAAEMGRASVDIPPLIRLGIAASFVLPTAGKVCLSVQGWAWYNWDKQRRA